MQQVQYFCLFLTNQFQFSLRFLFDRQPMAGFIARHISETFTPRFTNHRTGSIPTRQAVNKLYAA
jgi:hypothetical protein